jgi:pimeloyl-ACP methyl ester carboxylesterase
LAAVVGVVTWTSCGGDDDGRPPGPSNPTATPTACPTASPNECFLVRVPQRRRDGRADDRTVELFVVRQAPAALQDRTPLVLLAGGPGSVIVEALAEGEVLLELATALGRPVLVPAQRGVPPAAPDLSCPDFRRAGGADACIADLASQGFEAAAFNTLENAADMRDVVRALGYERAAFYGASYGSRLGLTIAREHPDVVESLVIAGAVFPSRRLSYEQQETLLDSMFAEFDEWYSSRCRADAACTAAMPDFTTVAASLEGAILRFEEGEVALTSRTRFGSVESLVEPLYASFYSQENRAFFIFIVHAIATGEIERAKRFLAGGSSDPERMRRVDERIDEFFGEGGDTDLEAGIALGMNEIVNCFDLLWSVRGSDPWCARLHGRSGRTEAEFAAALRRPQVPVLVLQGKFDPATFAAAAREDVAEQLDPSRTRYVEWECGAHDIANLGFSECHASIVERFLAAPSAPIDTACVATDCARSPLLPAPVP